MAIQFNLSGLDDSKLPLFNKRAGEAFADRAFLRLDSSDRSVSTEIDPQAGLINGNGWHSGLISVDPQSIGHELREMLQSPRAVEFIERIFEGLDKDAPNEEACDEFEDFLSKCPTAGVLDSISEYTDDFRELWYENMPIYDAALDAIAKINDSDGCFWGGSVQDMKYQLLDAAHTALIEEGETLSSTQLDALVSAELITEETADSIRSQSGPSM